MPWTIRRRGARGSFVGALVVDDEDDGASLKPLEPEDVAVEDLFGIPEAVPVGFGAFGLAGDLFGVAAAGGQQRDVFGPPAVVKKFVDLVVAGVHGVVPTAGDEGDVGPVAAEVAHGVVDQRLNAVAIWRVLRMLWSRISGTRGTGGVPWRSKTR